MGHVPIIMGSFCYFLPFYTCLKFSITRRLKKKLPPKHLLLGSYLIACFSRFREREKGMALRKCVQARRAVQGSPRMRAESCAASLEPPGRLTKGLLERGCGEGSHRMESMTEALETHRRQKKKAIILPEKQTKNR